MNLTKTQKTLIGILHFLPIIGMIFYFIFFFSFFLGSLEHFENDVQTGRPPLAFFRGFVGAFVILILTILISLGIKIFDIIHLTRSNKNDSSNKVLMWILLFVFTGTISEIVYYFIEILPEEKAEIEFDKTV
ncbi:hypothetical protein FIA58_007455 [Flavobacterium jejuense]|uniref:Cardiolipin synthase N-terminal domain-containing protein n=1 Tax=Flavobacterium jejuense TaxID=1544455 RepID=A0ABX0IR10_9FLAO|nr:hypothetical protein [Flavobacterium jejuense]NHN25510.1 hypothetical protein [Flavobacterium jejuense]